MSNLTVVTPAWAMTPDQKRLIRDTCANGASEEEFAALLAIAVLRNLNPLLKQIYFVKRWDKDKKRYVWAVQVAIDGLRALADRTGRYDGQDEPECIYDDKGRLLCCKVRVYRKDWTRPTVGVAYFAEYVQKTREGAATSFWANMPHVMLSKCAEAIALRKAFPEDMSGLYTPEEMQQADNGIDVAEVVEGPSPPLPVSDPPRMPAKVTVFDSLARDIGRIKGKEFGERVEAGKRDGSLTEAQVDELRKLYGAALASAKGANGAKVA